MAHQLMLHGHPVGYLPPTYASEILTSGGDTVQEVINDNLLTAGTLNFDVTVAANTAVNTTIDWAGKNIDKSKILFSWISWNNPSSDVPTQMITYYDYNNNNYGVINNVIHKWSVAQTVKFRVGYIMKG